MKTQSGLLRSLVTTSALALMMGFAGTASAVLVPLDTCTVNTTDPDAFATVTAGGALFAGCGLGDQSDEKDSAFLSSWNFYGKKDLTGDTGTWTGWTVTNYTGFNTGTWEINAGLFAADTEFLLLLKDGADANPADVTPDTKWVWFEISSFEGVSGGDWTMWGGKESSHMSLYVRDGDTPANGRIPEPGMLSLLGVGLLGQVFWMRRRRQQK